MSMGSATFIFRTAFCDVPRSRNSRRRAGGRTQSIAVFRLIIPAAGALASIEAAAGALGNNIATLHVLK